MKRTVRLTEDAIDDGRVCLDTNQTATGVQIPIRNSTHHPCEHHLITRRSLTLGPWEATWTRAARAQSVPAARRLWALCLNSVFIPTALQLGDYYCEREQILQPGQGPSTRVIFTVQFDSRAEIMIRTHVSYKEGFRVALWPTCPVGHRQWRCPISAVIQKYICTRIASLICCNAECNYILYTQLSLSSSCITRYMYHCIDINLCCHCGVL